MKKFNPYLFIGVGFLLLGATVLSRRLIDIPHVIDLSVSILSTIFLLCGAILLISLKTKNSKLRQWKLRLIGKEPKQ